MLRSTLICFASAIGAAALVYAFVTTDDTRPAADPVKRWNPADAHVASGLPIQGRGSIAVQFDASGRAIIEFEGQGVDLASLPVLHLDFAEQSDALAMVVGWRTQASKAETLSTQIGISPGEDFWFNLSATAGWNGEATALVLVFLGPPGGEVRLKAASLHPLSYPQILRLTVADWKTFIPWQHSSINSHIGVTQVGKYPFPAVAAALVVSIGITFYFVGCLLLRRRFDWRVPGLLCLICWVGLDSLWQYKLQRQSVVTEQTFAGKTPHDKRLASHDSSLYTFVQTAREAIAEPDARLFIASASDFHGMRGSYFAYPQNVYWERHATSLPADKHIQKGDFVLLLRPIRAGFDKDTGVLQYGDGMNLNTELMLSNEIGALFRVI